MGFKADVIVWDFESMTLYCRLVLHKVKVEALAFSPNERYLATLGGQDDGRFEYFITLFLAIHLRQMYCKTFARVRMYSLFIYCDYRYYFYTFSKFSQ